MPIKKLVFIDESGVNTNQTRRYGRSLKGERFFDNVPLVTKRNFTVVSSVRIDGKKAARIYEGALNGERFKDYLEHTLLPTLNPGDIIVGDNLRSHKVRGVYELLNRYDVKILYLPPYSPDFNPIEEMRSKMKAILRKTKCRVREEIPTAINDALSLVTQGNIISWFNRAFISLFS
ncbi:MAG: transposase [Clostridiales bacterium]|nr:transposase [Clostridiales bacterium]